MKSNNSLNQLLADVALAKQNAANLHWNVRGPWFKSLHKITETLYEGLDDFIDDIAEKVAMSGEMPLSTYSEYLKFSTIKELESKNFNINEVINHAVENLNQIQKTANSVEASDVVQPLLDEVYLFVDKQRWIFKSHQES